MNELQAAWEILAEWIWLLIPLALLQFVLFLAALVSVLRKPVTGTEKLPWILLLFVNIIGPILYFVIGSGKLDEKAARRGDGE